MSQPPAAWHPDPENPQQLRWWDGHRWTGATAPASTVTTAATSVNPAPVQGGQKRRTGWRNFGIIVGALVVGGVLARLSLVALILPVFAAFGIGLFVLLSRPVPALGLRSRSSGLAVVGIALLVVTGGGIASASTGGADRPTASEPAQFASTPSTSPNPPPTPIPTTFSVVSEEAPIPFEATTADDPLRDQGTTALVTAGVNGVKVITYRVTMVDGVETSRELVNEVVKTAPVNEVTAIGSKVPAPAPAPAPVPLVQQGGGGCDPNYADACVPIDRDVDCAGGSGDGPSYVQGPVRIVGNDIYDLDRDGDGIACDR